MSEASSHRNFVLVQLKSIRKWQYFCTAVWCGYTPAAGQWKSLYWACTWAFLQLKFWVGSACVSAFLAQGGMCGWRLPLGGGKVYGVLMCRALGEQQNHTKCSLCISHYISYSGCAVCLHSPWDGDEVFSTEDCSSLRVKQCQWEFPGRCLKPLKVLVPIAGLCTPAYTHIHVAFCKYISWYSSQSRPFGSFDLLMEKYQLSSLAVFL